MKNKNMYMLAVALIHAPVVAEQIDNETTTGFTVNQNEIEYASTSAAGRFLWGANSDYYTVSSLTQNDKTMRYAKELYPRYIKKGAKQGEKLRVFQIEEEGENNEKTYYICGSTKLNRFFIVAADQGMEIEEALSNKQKIDLFETTNGLVYAEKKDKNTWTFVEQNNKLTNIATFSKATGTWDFSIEKTPRSIPEEALYLIAAIIHRDDRYLIGQGKDVALLAAAGAAVIAGRQFGGPAIDKLTKIAVAMGILSSELRSEKKQLEKEIKTLKPEVADLDKAINPNTITELTTQQKEKNAELTQKENRLAVVDALIKEADATTRSWYGFLTLQKKPVAAQAAADAANAAAASAQRAAGNAQGAADAAGVRVVVDTQAASKIVPAPVVVAQAKAEEKNPATKKAENTWWNYPARLLGWKQNPEAADAPATTNVHTKATRVADKAQPAGAADNAQGAAAAASRGPKLPKRKVPVDEEINVDAIAKTAGIKAETAVRNAAAEGQRIGAELGARLGAQEVEKNISVVAANAAAQGAAAAQTRVTSLLNAAGAAQTVLNAAEPANEVVHATGAAQTVLNAAEPANEVVHATGATQTVLNAAEPANEVVHATDAEYLALGSEETIEHIDLTDNKAVF